MKKTDSDTWTQEDIEKILAAIEVLQNYNLDTSSVNMNLVEVLPHALPVSGAQ